MASLTGRVVAITGGARGIGLATARELSRRGCKVAIGDIDVDGVKSAADDLGGAALGIDLDVTDRASFDNFLARVEDELGPLDVLVNNAGIMPVGHFEHEPDEVTRRQFDINVHGVINGMKSALALMLPRNRGHIVNVASQAGKVPVAGAITYAGTKHAVVGLTGSAILEYMDTGVDFSIVMPAFVNTDLISGTKPPKGVPPVEPEDVAGAIADAVEKPRAEVFVPRMIVPLIKTAPLMPAPVSKFLVKAFGMERGFLDHDPDTRKDYEDRIRS
ncbi:MAG: SDR family oxidoreductase [Nitriliruptorales bacterium]|nr:SDR family oxidoreductase [Nitriliruptorales bacterium]